MPPSQNLDTALATTRRERERRSLIDVRSPEEWMNGHIPEAQFLTLELKFEALDTWPKDTRIVFYSNAGRRSLEVASYFMAYGFTNVRNMAGGLEAWSVELLASNVPPLTVEVSATNDRKEVTPCVFI